MNKALYKAVYDKIQLNNEQKRNIMQELGQCQKNRRKKRRLPAYAAACLCVLMLSNVVVFAAEHISLGEWIAAELGQFWDSENNLSEEQAAVYDEHSVKLGQLLTLEHGTVTFEFMLCDNSYLYIPYTFCPDSEENLYAMPSLSFAIKGDEPEILQQFYRLEPISQGNKKLHGRILLGGTFHQGDILQVYKPEKGDFLGKLICELPVSKIKNVQNVAFDAQEIKEKTKIGIKDIKVSPLSIQISGNYDKITLFESPLHVELERKDGTIVKEAKTGSSGEVDEFGKGGYNFQFRYLFESPVNLDELSGIRIRLSYGDGKECWIPL